MARVVAEDTSLPVSRAETCASPTLAQLLKCVSDVRKEVTGDETPVHHVVDVSSSSSIDTRPLPFLLSFSHLTYSVRVTSKVGLPSFFCRRAADPVSGETLSSGTKTILSDISGEARDGEIMAVMGASGSGKSTLIDALANRMAKGSVKGSVKLNGEELESRLLKVISAYVMQDDLLFPMLTVEETLMFAAEFRLPRTLSKSKKKLRVQALIDQLGLRNATKTVIGDEGHRGVSGGERRRVSIGIDIIHDPILLFLDEPTSGLDSTSAYMVVKVLQRIAQSGSIVIMSIHQPSYRIMGLLDRMIFLSRGKTVYSGPPSNLPLFFSDFGHPIPDNENRTEFTLDLIRELEGSSGGTKSLVEFNKSWQALERGNQINSPAANGSNLSLKEAISASISRGKLVSGAAPSNSSTSMIPTFTNPSWFEFAVLSKRSFTNSRRMPELFGVRLATVLVTGFILATMFWRLDNSPKGIQERLGFFAFAMSTTFYTCADALPVFLQERYIFMRETAYNAYRRSSYVLSHSLVSLPALLFLSLAFAAITFWPVGLDGSFLFYFLIILASFWAGSSFVTFLSGVVPHVMLGYVIVVAILAYFLLFSGFFPGIFDGTPLGAVPDALKLKILESMSSSLGMKITSGTCVMTGADILKQQVVTDLSKWSCLWVTLAWGFFFRSSAFLLSGKLSCSIGLRTLKSCIHNLHYELRSCPRSSRLMEVGVATGSKAGSRALSLLRLALANGMVELAATSREVFP
ncbi:ABC transporter G family member 1 [Sesamum indicum]|uniref:ABC transporter G family member 1 n=1 Tax=Sesamum indicum TaxID=4182 RepID=A0A8M8V9X0_SESIN|nr:ABC transporter G family member 1 [Sesamum indicum]